jgi:hypothetical protein
MLASCSPRSQATVRCVRETSNDARSPIMAGRFSVDGQSSALGCPSEHISLCRPARPFAPAVLVKPSTRRVSASAMRPVEAIDSRPGRGQTRRRPSQRRIPQPKALAYSSTAMPSTANFRTNAAWDSRIRGCLAQQSTGTPCWYSLPKLLRCGVARAGVFPSRTGVSAIGAPGFERVWSAPVRRFRCSWAVSGALRSPQMRSEWNQDGTTAGAGSSASERTCRVPAAWAPLFANCAGARSSSASFRPRA